MVGVLENGSVGVVSAYFFLDSYDGSMHSPSQYAIPINQFCDRNGVSEKLSLQRCFAEYLGYRVSTGRSGDQLTRRHVQGGDSISHLFNGLSLGNTPLQNSINPIPQQSQPNTTHLSEQSLYQNSSNGNGSNLSLHVEGRVNPNSTHLSNLYDATPQSRAEQEYMERLRTFNPIRAGGSPFPNPSIQTPEAFAMNGLVFEPVVNRPDAVRCSSCKVVIYSWERDDDPAVEHTKHALQGCTFVDHSTVNYENGAQAQPLFNETFRQTVTNPSPTRQGISNEGQDDSNILSPNTLLELIKKNIKDGIGLIKDPAYNHVDLDHIENDMERLKTYQGRLDSFRNWPKPDIVSGSSLAKAGFYRYKNDDMGKHDSVKCAFCFGVLSDWWVGEVPLDEHVNHFDHCKFARKLKQDEQERLGHLLGQQTPAEQPTANYNQYEWMSGIIAMGYNEDLVKKAIDALVSENKQVVTDTVLDWIFENENSLFEGNNDCDEAIEQSQPSRTVGNEPSSIEGSSLSDRNNSLEGSDLMCKVCFEQDIAGILLPCNHALVCVGCYDQLGQCPTCRKTIEGMYFLQF